ncbi:Anthranilate phosphoribosyltransferase [compost metagenome]
MVVHGLDGMDEISMTAPTEVYEIRNGKITYSLFEPKSLGLSNWSHEDIRGGSIDENRTLLFDLLEGKPGAICDITCVNAGAALLLSGQANCLSEGYLMAKNIIDSGTARAKLDELIKRSNQTTEGEMVHVHA